MKKIIICLIAMLVIAMYSMTLIISATDTGASAGISVITQKFAPNVFLCQNRTMIDDSTQNGANGLLLTERKHNYAFEGESIQWLVFVMDKNKIEEVTEVVGTIGQTPGIENDAEVGCKRIVGDPFANSVVISTVNVVGRANVTSNVIGGTTVVLNGTANVNVSGTIVPVTVSGMLANVTTAPVLIGISGTAVNVSGTILNVTVTGIVNDTGGIGTFAADVTGTAVVVTIVGPSNPFSLCNARVDQSEVTVFNPATMAYYDCRFTVETPASMHGEYFLTVEAIDNTGRSGIMAENEYWFLNPVIGLSVDPGISFNEVTPGTDAYSNTILVGNDAEAGSGVMLDMFISGTDFYDPDSVGTRCSDNTNKLALKEFRYFVTNGAYDSLKLRDTAEVDHYGYTSIPPSTEISGSKRIMRYNTTPRGAAPSSSVTEADWNNGNALSPESEMAVTFRLSMPEPCVGDFSEGQIYFWGEAI